MTLYTDDPSSDLEANFITTKGNKKLKDAVVEYRDPGAFLDRPVEISNPEITSPFNPERVHPVTGKVRPHRGDDISSTRGSAGIENTSVLAPAGGKILRTGFPKGGADNYVVLDIGDGRTTKFFHLNSIGVKAGQYVSRGATLGTVGNTGIGSGPHLHWEYRQNGHPITPNYTLGENHIPYR